MDTNPPNVTDDDEASAAKTSEPLPLGWTHVKRNRVAPSNGTSAASASLGADTEWCCDDPNCNRRAGEHVSLQKASNEVELEGQAIFCLHDIDPSWFQGYLSVTGGRNPWGLLAVQEELDECLQCADGGYRQISLTVMPYQEGKKMQSTNVEWTGGDMMKLASEKVAFEADQFWTGKQAVPYVQRYFSSLLQKIEGGENKEILELLPDVAVVMGEMKVCMPAKQEDDGEM